MGQKQLPALTRLSHTGQRQPSAKAGLAQKPNNEWKFTLLLLLPLLRDSFYSCKLSGSHHSCTGATIKGPNVEGRVWLSPKMSDTNALFMRKAYNAFFRADHSAINISQTILYSWHLPLFLFYLESEVTRVFAWNVCSAQISQRCWVTPRDCKGVAAAQVAMGSNCLLPSVPLSTGVSALSGALLEKCIRGKEG